MNYQITHKTHYIYSDTANLSYNEARLTPRSFARHPYKHYSPSGVLAAWGHLQQVHRSRFVVEPQPTNYREREDFFGNTVSYFAIQRPHQTLTVTVTSQVEVKRQSTAAREGSESVAWETVREQLQTSMHPEILEARQYVLDSPMIPTRLPELREYATPSFAPGRPLREAVRELTERLYTDFTYEPGETTVATPLEEALAHRRGVCQDFAHLGIGCLRAMGLAARYVSGYIETMPPPGQERLVGADASHAWFSVYVPDMARLERAPTKDNLQSIPTGNALGSCGEWLDFDPTNNQVLGEQHITVAWGRDYSDVTLLKGVVFGSGTHELSVSVDCQREANNDVPETTYGFQK